jgi:DNA-binding NtrC family response regulator
MSAVPALLIAEDDADLRELLLDLLRDDGVEADGAGDGEEALARFDTRRYDVVLADVDMPRLDGVGLLDRLHHRQPELPVILMTGFATPDRIRRALARGASDCLSKPFSRAALLDAVRRALARSGSGSPRPSAADGAS